MRAGSAGQLRVLGYGDFLLCFVPRPWQQLCRSRRTWGLYARLPGFQPTQPTAHKGADTARRQHVLHTLHTWAHKVAHAAGRGPFAASQEWVDLYRRLLVFVLCRIVSRRVGSCHVLSCPNWGAAAIAAVATAAVCVCVCVCVDVLAGPSAGAKKSSILDHLPILGSSSWTLTSYHRLQGV